MDSYSIKTYNKKRDFKITPEPSGETIPSKDTLSFVIQKHAATRLHYDFRLEWDGVLKSWAVPKGPSFNPKDKRLAVRTEDHPLSYASFEGVIPAKQYGAGNVIIWDEGQWIPEDKDVGKALKKGKLSFTLKGKRLAGAWTLARMGGARNKDKENWLLIKQDDAVAKDDPDFLEKNNTSIHSGVTVKEIDKQPKKKAKAKTKAKAKSKKASVDLTSYHEEYHDVQLATLVDEPPKGDDWLHEVKYDGYRILAFAAGDQVYIYTRNGYDWTEKFSVIADALREMNLGPVILDGEAVMLNEQGLTDFKLLQNALGEPGAPMQAYFFDLLLHQQKDCRKLTLKKRRQLLEEILEPKQNQTICLSDVLQASAEDVIAQACKLGLEGIISKKQTATYQPGRSKSWLKSKCIKRQEFIICGFVEASDRSNAIGALHLGYYKNDQLHYGGKVGTGFDYNSAANLYKKLIPLKQKTHPFPKKLSQGHKGTIWVKPELLCEVKFAAWTDTGKVRHASYQGLREDKAPEEITQEKAKPLKKVRPKKAESFTVSQTIISNPDRIIFPEAELTKGELAGFYFEMAEFIMPHIQNRLISVVRCPAGISKQCFFQRGKGKGMPEHIYVQDIIHNSKTNDYMYIKEAEGLVELVQMGGIEIHQWGSRIDNIDKPDRIVFDLDPSEDVPFEAIKLAAQDVKRRLQVLGLTSFLKATGGKGLHVTAPIRRTCTWEEVKTFTRGFASQMAQETPAAYTTNMSKKKRTGKIFIDYLRNDHASTAVMDYCVRARAGAPVSTPLEWEELEALEAASQFTMADVLARKKKARSLLKDYFSVQQTLSKKLLDSFQ